MSWKVDRIRWKFLGNLFIKFGVRDTFTVAEAYAVYLKKGHARSRYGGKPTMGYWQQMNVRNTLCAAVTFGYLTRVKRGVYRFV